MGVSSQLLWGEVIKNQGFMEELIAYRSDLLSLLGRVVVDMSRTIASLPAGAMQKTILLGSHSAHYWLFDLREIEAQVFASQLPRFISEESPLLPIFDDEAWMADHYHPEEPLAGIMEALAFMRHHELGWLRDLTPASWSRSARHPWWGLHTLQWWVEQQLDGSTRFLKQLTALSKQ